MAMASMELEADGISFKLWSDKDGDVWLSVNEGEEITMSSDTAMILSIAFKQLATPESE